MPEERGAVMKAGLVLAVVLAGLASALPAAAGGKKEGTGESGGNAVAPMSSSAAGEREKLIHSEQLGEKLGTIGVTATMMAGAGAGKCRMNYVLFNDSSATVAVGMLASAVSAKGEIQDNWVINVGALAPGAQTTRLFSCAIGAAQLTFSPLTDFGTPPVKCVNARQELEPCSIAMRIRSSLPMIDKDQIKPTADAGGGGGKAH